MSAPAVTNDTLAGIAAFEGTRLTSYQDQAGVWTIGCGHTGPEVTEGLQWSAERCTAALGSDIAWARSAVWRATHDVDTSPAEYGAMVSLCFNIGAGAFRLSSVLAAHRRGNRAAAKAAFALWNKVHIDGVLTESAGLTRRRKCEAAMYAGIGWRKIWVTTVDPAVFEVS
jgi:lysozyme